MLTSPDNDEQNLNFASSDEGAPDAVQEDANTNANASIKHHDEPPLASWFSQYSTSSNTSSRNVNTTASNNISEGNNSSNSGIIVDDAKKKPATKNINGRRPTIDGDKIPSIANNNNNSNTEWGMVSDNEEGEGDADVDDDEGFNFVAISNSLLMAGRSFEHVSEENNDGGGGDSYDNDNDNVINAANSDTTRGVLIVDGLHPACPGSNFSDIGPSTVGGTNNNATTTNGGNIDSSGTLSIPGSDSLPSDLGTLSHHDEDNFFGGNNNNKGSDDHEDGNQDSGSGSEGTAGTAGARDGEDPYHRNYPPLIHRFLMNLQQTTRRRRLVSDNNDDDDASRSIIHQDSESIHQDNDNGDDVVVEISLDHQHRGEEPSSAFNLRKQFRGISVMRIMSIALVTSLIVLMSWIGHSLVVSQRRQEEEWKQRLLQEEEHKARLMAEKDELRLEMEVLQEQASAAWAQADSLAKEQEKWMILQQETERMTRKQKHQQQDEDEEERRGSRKRGRQQDNHDSQEKDNGNNDDFGWFFNEKNEDCNADRRKNEESGGGSTTYTIADNCWVKAKADINLGSCGDDTKDFFKDVWNGLWYSSWDDWDNYFDTTTSSDTIGEPYTHGGSSSSSNRRKHEEPQQEKEEQQSNHDDAADNDPSKEDPFQELFSVITSAGQSFASKFSQLVTDEVDTTRKAAEDLEDAVLRGYADVSKTFSNTMYAMKDDMRDLSKETLSKLRTAVKNNNNNNNNSNNSSNSNNKGTASKIDRQHSSSSSQSNDDEDATTGHDTKGTTTSSTTTQPVTLQGLNDAVAALSSLSKTLHDTTKSLSSLTEEDAVGRKEHATTDL